MLTLLSRCLSALLILTAAYASDQPLPYSHKTHVALGLKCSGCHSMPGKGEMATFPSESLCMGCHVSVKKGSPHIQALAKFAKEKTPVPWKRVYRLPDYVWFSHKIHMKGATCEKCHGDVGARDVVTREKPITMAACMSCHEETDAPNECNVCHDQR